METLIIITRTWHQRFPVSVYVCVCVSMDSRINAKLINSNKMGTDANCIRWFVYKCLMSDDYLYANTTSRATFN